MAHDDQFTALGAQNLAVPGFSTSATSLTYGVNVQGTFCGVYGEALANGPDPETERGRQAMEKTGVYGTGDRYGVYGITGKLGIGDAPNFGAAGNDAIGVVGVSFGRPGVIGISDRVRVPANLVAVGNPTLNPVGVVGISRSSPGVYGLSVKDGVGVVGRVGVFDAGIEKKNSQGAGVYGASRVGRGGVFESGDPKSGRLVAQLQLVPQEMDLPALRPAVPKEYDTSELKALPKDGKGGDLLVTTTKKGICVLWFCVLGGKKDGPPAQWSQVLLGAPVANQK